MGFQTVQPAQWLTDKNLTDEGRAVRRQYARLCEYLDTLGLLSFQTARAKYFLEALNYWTLPEGFALPPHTLNVCVNNLCNMRCRYCDFGQKHEETFYHKYNVVEAGKKVELELELVKDLVDQAAWYRPIIRASFREPLLYNHLIPFLEYTKEKGLPFWLLTNGYKLAGMATRLVEAGLDSIRLSLDGPPEAHDEIRNTVRAYERMMEGVKAILDERRARGSKLQVGFYFTLNDFNYDKILATVDNLAAEGILKDVFLNFQWLLYTSKNMARQHNAAHGKVCGGYIEESTLQTVDIEKMDPVVIADQCRQVREKYPAEEGYRIHFRPSFEYEDLVSYRDTEEFPVDNPRCLTPWYNLNINPAGEVKCFHHCLLPVSGNVYQDSLLDIWNGPVMREQRERLQEYGAYRGCARCWGIYSLLENTKRAD